MRTCQKCNEPPTKHSEYACSLTQNTRLEVENRYIKIYNNDLLRKVGILKDDLTSYKCLLVFTLFLNIVYSLLKVLIL